MSESETVNHSAAPPGNGIKVAAAALAASVAAGAFWASENMQHAERWQDGAIAAGAVALMLLWMASKRTPRGRQVAFAALLRGGIDAASKLRSQLVEAAKTQKVEAPAKAATPDVNPLEAERARLLKAGYSESDVSQILIARESAAHATPALGSGVVTGVLNNLGGIAAHAKNILPSLKADLLHLIDGEATGRARIGAAVSLALKAMVIAVLAYVVSLEFIQFKAATERARAEACSARAKAIIDTVPMNQVFEAVEKLTRDCPQ
jgi:hypothetical protein